MWGDCPKKYASRQRVIDTYRAMTGKKSLPRSRQYWSMCGIMNNNGELHPKSELSQILDSKLISERQFYGVEKDDVIYEANSVVINDGHMHIGDIIDVMSLALKEGWFNPGFVNLDTMHQPKEAVNLLAKAMNLLNYIAGDIVVMLNVVMEIRGKGFKTIHTWEDVDKAFKSNQLYKHMFDHGWSRGKSLFVYDGTGSRSSTKMGTIPFIRKGKALCLPWA